MMREKSFHGNRFCVMDGEAHLRERGQLGGVADAGAGAVGLDQPDGGGGDAGQSVGVA